VPEYNHGFKKPRRARHFAVVALYVLILAGILVLGRYLDAEQEPKNVFGSLDGRFTSDISLDYGGKTVYYRENEITNYLLIGMDCEKQPVSAYQDGGQADFLLVLSIDRVRRTVTPLMIDRDTMAQVTTYGIFGNAAGTRRMQICLAQAFSGSGVSGSRNTARAVSALLGGIEIDRCLLMDLKGIALLNDAVGGVTVTLDDDLTALDASLARGATVTLKGDLAERFVRGRTTVADGTNLSRMNRQKTYIKSLIRTTQTQMEKDASFIASVLDALEGHLESDTDKSILLGDANAYKNYVWQEMQMLPGTHRVGEDGFAEFWVNEPAAAKMIVETWFK